MLIFVGIDQKTKVRIRTIHQGIMEKLKRQFSAKIIAMITEKPITVKYNTRLKTTAGRASKDKIELNLPLLSENPSELPQVYAHELAHTICCRLWPKKRIGHDRNWKLIMTKMGFQPRSHGHKAHSQKNPERRYQIPL
ncbi:SprT-like domain-containing protein [Synechococcus sp. PCC 6312]|uniref:SprT-like domain-containing protein n=1 Tax=Synechococcus sp. (strain ATCC 27167 / PCC 6312) TaxID=195253 RepID=UPI00029F4C6E|nr:SprT-like domain-containing protein [Synechococcus sp. PCC 6312]AFY61961.1 hypothetical protein Syn6312_2898 [Synechococcus sp. PCC 6312]